MHRHVATTLLHMHKGSFPPKVQKQMTVTSLDDLTDVLLMYIGGGIKGSAHETTGLSGSGS